MTTTLTTSQSLSPSSNSSEASPLSNASADLPSSNSPRDLPSSNSPRNLPSSNSPRDLQEPANIATSQETFPRLKNGIYISTLISSNETSITVATSTYGIQVNHKDARSIIEQFTGILNSLEIAQKLDIPIATIETVIKELLAANFIDTQRNTIKLNNRFHSSIASRALQTEDQSNDAAFSQLQKRLAPELSYTTWLDGVLDGGVNIMTSRQNFGVEIVGNSRTATLLYSILLASGVTNTRISLPASYKHSTVVDGDLGSGSLRTTDLGLNFKKRLEELSREWSLFPIVSSFALAQRGATKPTIPEKNLRIICGKFDSQYVEHLLRDGHDHFFVGRIPGHAATIGPFVKPGESPCRACLARIEAERMGGFELSTPLGTSDELPVAIAHQVASLAAHAALKFIDTGECELVASQLVVDFLDAFNPRLQHFPQHPECSCLWPDEDLLL